MIGQHCGHLVAQPGQRFQRHKAEPSAALLSRRQGMHMELPLVRVPGNLENHIFFIYFIYFPMGYAKLVDHRSWKFCVRNLHTDDFPIILTCKKDKKYFFTIAKFIKKTHLFRGV
jgi:hypothetical protein